MITRFRVQNYKALRDVTLDLTPIHLLIGPNDTGKTSILEAIAALCRSVDHSAANTFTGLWEGRSLAWKSEPIPIGLTAKFVNGSESSEYRLHYEFGASGRNPRVVAEKLAPARGDMCDLLRGDAVTGVYNRVHDAEIAPDRKWEYAQSVHHALAGIHSYRWVPSLLRLPVAPDSKRRFRMEPSGFGLVLCLDDITGHDVHRFLDVQERFKRIFPNVESIKLLPEPAYRAPSDDPLQIPMLAKADGKGLYFEFVGGGELVPASQVSDGLLLVLAYLAILHLPEPPRVLLVEEPENGIHPKRLQDVLTILRDLVKEQSHTQVILTTHSPYVVDLCEPKEVTLCKKEDDGSISTHRLSDSKTVREQLDVFTLGEIWTAEGDDALANDARSDEASS